MANMECSHKTHGTGTVDCAVPDERTLKIARDKELKRRKALHDINTFGIKYNHVSAYLRSKAIRILWR